MRWFEGSITAAITAAKQRNVLFVVYVRGDDDASTQMDCTWEDQDISQLCEDCGMVALKFNADSDECKQFSQYYPVKIIPCISFISGLTGEPLKGTEGYISTSEFKQNIQQVLQMTKQSSSTTGPTQAAASTPSPATGASGSSISPQPSTVSPASSLTTQAQAPTPVQASASASSQAQQKELSKLEKAARLRQKMEEIHQRKEAEKEEDLKRKEMERRKVGQAVQKSMQERSEVEARRIAQELRKEKEEDRLAKERVREQIARDRAEKQSRYESNKQERQKSQAAAQEAAQAAKEAPKRKINMLMGRKRMMAPKRFQRFQLDKVYICPQCLKEYNAKGSLRRHLKIEHGPKVFSWCRRCEYHCNRRDNLRRHYVQYHTQYVGDLETIALETLEQRNNRVWLENAERRLTTSKARGSQKRKTGRKTWNDSRSYRRGSSAGSTFVIQQSLHEGSQENSSETHDQNEWVPVKTEPGEMLQLPSSSSSCPVSKTPISGPVWNDMARQQDKYWTGWFYECPQCDVTFQHSNSLFQHLQKHCNIRSKGRDNPRKHYSNIHSPHREDVDVIASKSLSQKETREELESQGGIEAVGDSSSRSLNDSGSFCFRMPATVNEMTGPSSGLCPDAANVHGDSEQPGDTIMASSSCMTNLPVPVVPLLLQHSPAGQTPKDSQEAISASGHVFPAREEESPYSASSQPICDAENSAGSIHLTWPSEPLHAPGDVQHVQQTMEGAVPQGKEPASFICPKCSREYLQLGSLKRHLRLDHGPPTYFWCRYCYFRTNRKDNFKRHYKQWHPEHVEEVKVINVETNEEKRNRERQKEIEERQAQRSRGSKIRLIKGVQDAGRDQTHLQRMETVSTSNAAERMEEYLPSQTNELCQESAFSQAVSSKSSILSQRVELLTTVYPEYVSSDAAPTCSVHTGSDGTIDSNNFPQNKTPDTMLQDSPKPFQEIASNAIENAHSERHSKRMSQHRTLTCNLDKSTLPLSPRKKADHKLTDSSEYAQGETSNQRFGLINSLQPKGSDGNGNDSTTYNSSQRNMASDEGSSWVKPTRMIVTGNAEHKSLPSNKDNVAHNPARYVQQITKTYTSSDPRLEALSPPTFTATKNAAQDSPNAEQSVPNSPKINVNVGYESSTINLTNNAVDLHATNSQQTETMDISPQNLNSLQQQNSSCNLQGLADSAHGKSVNSPVQEESPVTSTSEAPCIPLTRLEEVLRGNVTKVIEESHTVIYKDGTRIREETVKRTYEVSFQADFGKGTVKPR